MSKYNVGEEVYVYGITEFGDPIKRKGVVKRIFEDDTMELVGVEYTLFRPGLYDLTLAHVKWVRKIKKG